MSDGLSKCERCGEEVDEDLHDDPSGGGLMVCMSCADEILYEMDLEEDDEDEDDEE